MKNNPAAWLLLLAWIVVCGCKGPQTYDEARQVAEQRFNHHKADIKAGLAKEQFDRGQIAKARESIQEAISLDPDQVDNHLLLASIELEHGDLGAARRLLQNVTRKNKSLPEAWYLYGILEERSGYMDRAEEHYRRAHLGDPMNTAYLMAYGEMLISLNRPQEALDAINARFGDVESSGRLQVLRAEALTLLERYPEAADAYRRALIEMPEDPAVIEAYAITLSLNREYAEAAGQLNKLIAELGPKTPVRLRKMVARCHLELGEPAAAARRLTEVTAEDAEDVKAWLMLARCHIALDDPSSALNAARRAVSLAPQDAEAKTTLGFVLSSLGRWTEAHAALQSAVDLDDDNDMALCLLGYVSTHLGAPDAALACYHKVLSADPQHRLARSLYDRLQTSAQAEVLSAQKQPSLPSRSR